MKIQSLYSQRCWIDGQFQAATIHIEGEEIRSISEGKNFGANAGFLDAGDAVLMPGVIDTHVHINEPGRTHWEGFHTATRAAAFGGITTLIDMPLNSIPVTTTARAFEAKLAAAKNQLHVSCGFWGGVIDGNVTNIQELIEAGCLGFKAFLTHSGIDEFPNASTEDLEAVMPVIADAGLPLLVHCELEQKPAPMQFLHKNPQSYAAWVTARPPEWEQAAIELMIDLCRKYRCRTHIVHVSHAGALPAIRAAKAEGLPLTAETCPHYLFWTAEEIPDGDTRYKCAPPIRDSQNRDQLLAGIIRGDFDFLASDHSPAPPETKELESGNLAKAGGGIAGLQFVLSACWTALESHMKLEAFIPLLTSQPASFAGLGGRKGLIAPGYDADLTIWLPEQSFFVHEQGIQHRHKVSPYTGSELFGRVSQTMVGGQIVFNEGEILMPFTGKVL